MWSWRDDVICLICLIYASSTRCTCSLNLVVIGLMEMEMSILILVLHEYLGKSWSHRLSPPYLDIFNTKDTYLQIRSLGHGWQKNEKKEKKKKNTGNYNALCISRKRNNAILVFNWKVHSLAFSSFLLALIKFSFWEEYWALGYNTM